MNNLKAIIKTNKGNININLLPEVAPLTVTNFVYLSEIGFYKNLKFHRVIDDFMIQGGDPTGTGMGGPNYKFIDEFKEGITFNKSGILAMANAGPNTNGSQFFITHVPTPWLNYKHTIFGEIISDDDQNVVNTIKQNDIIEDIEIIGDIKNLYNKNKDFYDVISKAMNK